MSKHVRASIDAKVSRETVIQCEDIALLIFILSAKPADLPVLFMCAPILVFNCSFQLQFLTTWPCMFSPYLFPSATTRYFLPIPFLLQGSHALTARTRPLFVKSSTFLMHSRLPSFVETCLWFPSRRDTFTAYIFVGSHTWLPLEREIERDH